MMDGIDKFAKAQRSAAVAYNWGTTPTGHATEMIAADLIEEWLAVVKRDVPAFPTHLTQQLVEKYNRNIKQIVNATKCAPQTQPKTIPSRQRRMTTLVQSEIQGISAESKNTAAQETPSDEFSDAVVDTSETDRVDSCGVLLSKEELENFSCPGAIPEMNIITGYPTLQIRDHIVCCKLHRVIHAGKNIKPGLYFSAEQGLIIHQGVEIPFDHLAIELTTDWRTSAAAK
eukprot:GHVT01047526.1.p1 GENE.GHVT01047526.1~~GHVT01047526.1.p1  ORF type:complete len:229 (-),score=23.44 GHVT01047526.1:518-1204(-)